MAQSQCIASRQNTLTDSGIGAAGLIAGWLTVAGGCWALGHTATPAIVTGLQYGLAGVGATIALGGLTLAARHLSHHRPKDTPPADDWLADIRQEPAEMVKMRGEGAAVLFVLPLKISSDIRK